MALKATRITGPYSPPLWEREIIAAVPAYRRSPHFLTGANWAFGLLSAFAEMIIGAWGQRFNSWSRKPRSPHWRPEDVRAAIELARSFSRLTVDLTVCGKSQNLASGLKSLCENSKFVPLQRLKPL